MASMSLAARLLLRGSGQSAVTQLLRGRPINFTDAARNTVSIRSLLLSNQTQMDQFPIFLENFPAPLTGFRTSPVFSEKQGIVHEADWLRTGTKTVEVTRGKRVVDEEDDEPEDDGDSDDVDVDDIDDFDDGELDSDDEDEDVEGFEDEIHSRTHK